MVFRAENVDDTVMGERRSRKLVSVRKPKHSPYFGAEPQEWAAVTRSLLKSHPLKIDDVVDSVLSAWNGIFTSQIGHQQLKIGQELKPAPQIMGFLLHELVPFELTAKYPRKWKTGIRAGEKDLVFKGEPGYSIEIKTSSHPTSIFGNRSYGQQGVDGEKKSKDGFYIAINFDKWDVPSPGVSLIRWGWLDHADWTAQNAASGQQANLPAVVENNQLLTLFKR